jgi:hypothetical protein
MTETPLIEREDFRYKALSQISKLANNLAWIVFVIYALRFLFNCGNAYLLLQYPPILRDDFSVSTNIKELAYQISLFLNVFSILVNGVIFALVLRGISVGLDMLIEIDTNYIKKSQGACHE